jgi:hypothetical protein
MGRQIKGPFHACLEYFFKLFLKSVNVIQLIDYHISMIKHLLLYVAVMTESCPNML